MTSNFIDAIFGGPSRVNDPSTVHCITPRRPVVWCQSHGSGDYSFYSGLVPRSRLSQADFERIRQYLGVRMGSATESVTTDGRNELASNASLAALLTQGYLRLNSADTTSAGNLIIDETTAQNLCGSGGLTPVLYCEHHLHPPSGPGTGGGYARYAPDMAAEIGTVAVDMGTTLGMPDVGHDMGRADAYNFCGYGDFTYTSTARSEQRAPQIEMLQLMPHPIETRIPAGLRRASAGGTGFLVAGTSFNARFSPIPIGHLTYPEYSAYGRMRYNLTIPPLDHAPMPPGDFFSVYATYLDSFAHQMLVRTSGSVGLPVTTSMRQSLTGPTSQRHSVDDASAILGYRTNNRLASPDSTSTQRPSSIRHIRDRAAHYICEELQFYGVDMYGIRIVSNISTPRINIGAWWNQDHGQIACFDSNAAGQEFFLVDDVNSFAAAAQRIAAILKQQLVHTDVD